jgi:hypothetical protein
MPSTYTCKPFTRWHRPRTKQGKDSRRSTARDAKGQADLERILNRTRRTSALQGDDLTGNNRTESNKERGMSLSNRWALCVPSWRTEGPSSCPSNQSNEAPRRPDCSREAERSHHSSTNRKAASRVHFRSLRARHGTFSCRLGPKGQPARPYQERRMRTAALSRPEKPLHEAYETYETRLLVPHLSKGGTLLLPRPLVLMKLSTSPPHKRVSAQLSHPQPPRQSALRVIPLHLWTQITSIPVARRHAHMT